MAGAKQKTIYFHVGTGKTGTTFLQYRVFPKFKGIHYIQRTRYNRAKMIIRRTNYSKYLISREFDQQLEQEVQKFSRDYPDAIPIIVFRRHDSYIASQYRRFVKNGYRGSFTEFFDLQNDEGYFKKKDLDYYSQIQFLEQQFTSTPLVLFYEEMREDPHQFIARLTQRMGIAIDLGQIDFTRKHTSYSEKQLKTLLLVGNYINLRKRRPFKNNILHLLWRFYLASLRYPTLFLGKIIPGNLLPKAPLIPRDEVEKVRKYFDKDWHQSHLYAENNESSAVISLQDRRS